MGKAILQFIVLTAIFLAVWFGLSRIHYIQYFHLDNISSRTEKKVGNLIIEQIKATNREIETDSATQALDDIKFRLCADNHINPDHIHLHLIHSDEVNAFALPGDHIVIYTGLIDHCDSASELCGVLSHELAHLQLHHVTKRLANEVGITVLAAAAGNGNSVVIARIIKMLSSTAFERQQESDADEKGVEYLQHAHINPKGFADLMLKIADMKADDPVHLEWLSTHPDSKKRAETIMELINTHHANYSPVIDDNSWQALKDAAGNE